MDPRSLFLSFVAAVEQAARGFVKSLTVSRRSG